MQKYTTLLPLFVFLIFLFSSLTVSASPTLKVTAFIIDENENSVQEADVKVWYIFPNYSGIGTSDKADEGKSDSKGFFTSSGESFMPQATIDVRKDGFYSSGKIVKFSSSDKLLNRWEPWNPTVEVILKKKRNPVPMYDNHRTSYNVPKLDTPIGFDLEKEDWVAPYGKGATSDFIINFNVMDRAYTDYECGFTLTFSNPHDGIQEYFFDGNDQSSFKWPFEAPDAGYLAQLSKRKTMTPGKGYKSDEKNNVNYLFRVRTRVDQNGNIIEAKYGKLVGEFGFVPNKQITFRYIFNPDSTRNLEEEPEDNLFEK